MSSLLYSFAWLCALAAGNEPGTLVIVGGGAIPDDVRQAFVDAAGGDKAIIAVLPQASQRAERGKASVVEFRDCGVAEAYVVELADRQRARVEIGRATAIWFPGGSQARLFESLKDADLIDLIHERHQAGVAIGGTSAGAAILSKVMIPTSPERPGLMVGNTPTMKGLGLTPQFIIDQHFIERARMNRLLSAVIDHSKQVGIGIGESTAIVVKGPVFTVQGRGSVVVIDGRKATIIRGEPKKLQSTSDLRLHVLRSGQKFDFEQSGVTFDASAGAATPDADR